MSVLNMGWSEIRSTLDEVTMSVNNQRGKKFVVYKPKKMKSCMVSYIHSALSEAVLGKIALIAKEKLKNVPDAIKVVLKTNNTPVFSIRPLAMIQELSKNILNSSKQERAKAELTLGLTSSEQIAAAKLAIENLKQYFEENPIVFSYTTKESELDDWKYGKIISTLHYLYDLFKIKRSESPFTFTNDDLEAFKISKTDISVNPEKISCFAYAFLQAKEKRASKLIFQDEMDKDILDLLQDWEYESVKEFHEGDLVVYFDGKEKVTHMGYYINTGQVVSKLGIRDSYISTHGLFEIPFNYGNKVVGFRKKQEI